MDYQLVRSNRRTVALVIDRQGNLVVRAPQRAPLEVIERFIGLKQNWIRQKSAEVKERLSGRRHFADGELFEYLGRQYPLRVAEGYFSKLRFDGAEFTVSKFQRHKTKALFADWYRRQACQLLPQRATAWAERMGLSYKRVMITAATTRWGSCSSQGTINFSWRLIAMAPEVVDYVVVHELAHLTHHNHSQKFWRLVARFSPAWRVMRRELRRQGMAQLV